VIARGDRGGRPLRSGYDRCCMLPSAYTLSDNTGHDISNKALRRVAPRDMSAGAEITDGT
jgi:hypothetical protein